MVNTAVRDFHDKLILDIANSKLPIGVVYYITEGVLSELRAAFDEAIKDEKLKEDEDNDN